MKTVIPYTSSQSVRRRKSYTKLTLFFLSSLGLLIFAIIALTFSSSKYKGPDVGGCRNIYMYPSYMRINGFDETHTRFAKKYSLFLYREQGKDPDFTKEQGIPVLFIPGNAGSYKQARSVASQTTNLYLEKYLKQQGDKLNLDFFTADFNEDLTAFHGRTMLDQAEYLNEAIAFILSLYELKPEHKRPKSVILLGHSMGGIVARLILTLPNYIEGTVNTIITLATPHSAAPATFDGDVMRIYSEMDNFWRSAFVNPDLPSNLHKVARNRLQNVSLISITGGLTDNTLPADYTQTNGLIPNNQSFTVFTTGVQDVYTPIDHLAIVWCDQLRKKLAEVLLSITTVSSVYCTYPIEKRMLIFRKHLLSGFEDFAVQDYSVSKLKLGTSHFDIRLKLDSDQINSNTLRIPAKINQHLDSSRGKINMFNIVIGDNNEFTLLSSLPFIRLEEMAGSSEKYPAVVGCKTLKSSGDNEASLIDYTTSSTVKFSELDCIDLVDDIISIPRSMLDTKSVSESSYGGEKSPFYVIQYNPDLVSLFDAILIIESPNPLDNNNEDFIIGELQPTDLTHITLGDASFWRLLTQGYDLSLPSRRPLAVDISIPSAWSSLLSYKVKINGVSSLEMAKQKFAPFIRQSIDNPFETKWHVGIHNSESSLITFHANSPFIQHDSSAPTNLHLQLWTDSLMMDEIPLDVYVSIDLFNSLKLLVLRYRLAVVSFPVAVCFLVLSAQLKFYQNTGVFISFWDGLLKLCDIHQLALILLILTLLTPMLNISSFDTLIGLLNPVKLSDLSYDGFTKHSSFLGLRENYLLFLGPLFFIISFALVTLIYQVIMIVGRLVTISFGLIIKTNIFHPQLLLVPSPPIEENTENTLHFFKTRRQVFGTIILLGAVSIYIPYQFAYIICCIMQLIVVFRTLIRFHYHHRYDPSFKKEDDDDEEEEIEEEILDESKKLKAEAQVSRPSKNKQTERKNLLNYHVTILNLLIWIIPINAPVVVVFLHNFSVRWTTPFSSHHNILAILPILLIVEKHVSGKMIIRNQSRTKSNLILQLLCIYIAAFSLLFGIKNLFLLHHLLSLFIGVMLFSF